MFRVCDLHNDFLTEIRGERGKRRYAEGVGASVVAAVWTSRMRGEQAIETIEQGARLIDLANEEREKDARGMAEGAQRLFLGVEDLHFISKAYLARIINVRPKYCSLTWNENNALAGGALEGGDLTPLGQQVARELERGGVFVDTAHLSERSFMSLSNITSRPLLCSHTAVHALCAHPRNLKDYQLRMIVESGGLVGLAFVRDFLTDQKRCTVSDVARHIDYVLSRYGEDHICLGTDFFGTKNTPKSIRGYKNLVLLEQRLRFLGYSAETIDKIFFLNAQRLLKA